MYTVPLAVTKSNSAQHCDFQLAGSPEEFRPLSCTPYGIVVLLAMHGVRIVGQTAVVIGKSRMVGTPMAAMLSSGGATVTQCDVHTEKTTLERKVQDSRVSDAIQTCTGLM